MKNEGYSSVILHAVVWYSCTGTVSKLSCSDGLSVLYDIKPGAVVSIDHSYMQWFTWLEFNSVSIPPRVMFDEECVGWVNFASSCTPPSLVHQSLCPHPSSCPSPGPNVHISCIHCFPLTPLSWTVWQWVAIMHVLWGWVGHVEIRVTLQLPTSQWLEHHLRESPT